MNNPYDERQRDWLDRLQVRYRMVVNGICMAAVRPDGRIDEVDCKGPLGFRHAIARRHLALIADGENKILANKEYGSFDVWPDKYEALQATSIGRFSAGKWSCQKHDERFGGIDARRIDLSNPENLFKAVYRVVLRQCHLTFARWHAFFVETKSDEDWELFRNTAFHTPASEEVALAAAADWRSDFHALMGKKGDLEQRLRNREWESLDFRALRLVSAPAVAGWGCWMNKPDYRGFRATGLGRPSIVRVELGYTIVIPQEDGHAIVTACERGASAGVAETVRVHDCMPDSVDADNPVKAGAVLRKKICRRFWELNELGMSESIYRIWSEKEREKAQKWMKYRGRERRPRRGQAPRNLPSFF